MTAVSIKYEDSIRLSIQKVAVLQCLVKLCVVIGEAVDDILCQFARLHNVSATEPWMSYAIFVSRQP